ncbi:MAG: hypothetical protein AAGA30_17640, partial [Planctomycetota bacterium]
HDVDLRSDIYSLGCTLFFILTGKAPFPDGTLARRLAAHQNQPPPSIESVRSDCPSYFLEAYSKMMMKDPSKRFQSTEELIEVLSERTKLKITVQSDSPSGSTPSLAKSHRKRRRKKKFVSLAISIIALLIGCFLTYFLIILLSKSN